MSPWLPDYIITYVIPIGGTAVALAGWIRAEILRRKAEAKEQVNAKVLDDIGRRANGPYFHASFLFADSMKFPLKKSGAVPTTLAPGSLIRLYLSNAGRGVRGATFSMPTHWSVHLATPGFISQERETEIQYAYEPTKRGELAKIRIDFETPEGLKIHQVYQTRIGHCEMHRIDPA